MNNRNSAVDSLYVSTNQTLLFDLLRYKILPIMKHQSLGPRNYNILFIGSGGNCYWTIIKQIKSESLYGCINWLCVSMLLTSTTKLEIGLN